MVCSRGASRRKMRSQVCQDLGSLPMVPRSLSSASLADRTRRLLASRFEEKSNVHLDPGPARQIRLLCKRTTSLKIVPPVSPSVSPIPPFACNLTTGTIRKHASLRHPALRPPHEAAKATAGRQDNPPPCHDIYYTVPVREHAVHFP